MPEIPQAVLADELRDAIKERNVRVAVFTTFSFDPGFFELHILPTLFDNQFSQVEKVKRIQIENALLPVDEVAVYYDRTAIAQEALPAQLDFRRIGVRGPKGVFHPKLVFVLVENCLDDDEQTFDSESLIFGCLSANLTRGGWWENVEAAHFVEIRDKDRSNERYSYRKDLLGLTKRIMDLGGPSDEQAAMGRVRDFLLNRVSRNQPKQVSGGGIHYPRVFFGQESLPKWLEQLKLGDGEWNLEVISPYFGGDNGGTLSRLVEALQPKNVRVYLPRDADGLPKVTEALFNSISDMASWSVLPTPLTRSGAGKSNAKAPSRFTHAKVYRLWRGDGKEIILSGSVNLTDAAHSNSKSGNLEASFLEDVSLLGKRPQWLLKPIEDDPVEFADNNPSDESDLEPVFIDLSLQFDWQNRTLSYRIDGDQADAVSVTEISGRLLFQIAKPMIGRWIKCDAQSSQKVETLLTSTSLVNVDHFKGSWRVLIREEGMIYRPSLLGTLTPDEILMYWSLLSDAQREAFIAAKLARDGQLDGLGNRTERYGTQNSLFDRFAGIYHAFEQLFRHVTDCIADESFSEAEARLFGAKYDSLPELLAKTLEQNEDPVMRYIVFLCGQQVAQRVRKHDREFWKLYRKQRQRLEKLLDEIPKLESELPLDDHDREEFLTWYREMFLQMIQQPVEIA